MTTTALEREFKRLHSDASRTKSALHNIRQVEKWVKDIDRNIRPVTGVYASGYAPRVDVTLEPMLVSSFNDGEFAALLDDIRELLYVDADDVLSEDSPETRCRSFILRDQVEGISMEYTIRVYLRDDSACQIIIDGYDEVKTSKFVETTERQPRMRFVCPEE